ncbi:MAG: DUF6788 family protein [Candidatus Binatia bacterium]
MSEPSAAAAQRRIDAIKRQIVALGLLRPGTLSQQYNVCGNPTCRCKADPPQKHGPYYQLSYTWRRKSRTHFVREEQLPQIQREVANYERLRALVGEWIDSALEIARLEREHRRHPQGKSPRKRADRGKRNRAKAKSTDAP